MFQTVNIYLHGRRRCVNTLVKLTMTIRGEHKGHEGFVDYLQASFRNLSGQDIPVDDGGKTIGKYCSWKERDNVNGVPRGLTAASF
mmetsp:Transcript_3978/g.9379  ORF Transcript_3978/g.9379 Transcript_3978/m.9379 type:complete len:86 (-) Transcript_3978:1654-1911(-)